MKKQLLLALLSFSIFACSTSNSPVDIQKTTSEKGTDHTFNTQASLTEAELVLDLTTLLKKNNSLMLVNRIVYYKNNYPTLFSSAMTNNPNLKAALKVNTAVMSKMKSDANFANFLNNVFGVITIAGWVAGDADNPNPLLAEIGPTKLTIDNTGNIYVSETMRNKIRKINSITGVTTFAGIGGVIGGFADNLNPLLAQFFRPTGLLFDKVGNLLVMDQGNFRIRQINSTTGVTTFAGDGTFGVSDNVNPLLAKFTALVDMSMDTIGNIYLTDASRIRKIDAVTKAVTTIAGTGAIGYLDNTDPLLAKFNNPQSIALDTIGNIYLTDDNRIRKIDAVTKAVTTIAGTGTSGYLDNTNPLLAQFNNPCGLILDSTGNIYIADTSNNRIRKIDAVTKAVTTIAGDGTSGVSSDNTNPLLAKITWPKGLAFDSMGKLYVATHNRIIKIQ